jgi:hypothetical protein
VPAEDISQEVRKRIAKAQSQMQKLQEAQAKSGTGGTGGPNAGRGGMGGAGASGKAARAARWVLITQAGGVRGYLAQLDGLGAVFAVPGSGDKWRYFRNVTGGNRTPEERDLSNDNRLFWTSERPSMTREFCDFVGIPAAAMLVIFLPIELEDRMAELEKAYKGLSDDQIAQTRFQAIQKDGRYDVMVVGQTPR